MQGYVPPPPPDTSKLVSASTSAVPNPSGAQKAAEEAAKKAEAEKAAGAAAAAAAAAYQQPQHVKFSCPKCKLSYQGSPPHPIPSHPIHHHPHAHTRMRFRYTSEAVFPQVLLRARPVRMRRNDESEGQPQCDAADSARIERPLCITRWSTQDPADPSPAPPPSSEQKQLATAPAPAVKFDCPKCARHYSGCAAPHHRMRRGRQRA